MAEVRPRIAFALQLFALLATASSQSCPVSGQTRVACSTPSACQSTCATANIFIACVAVCVVNGCECPRETFINEEMNACVRPAGCAKLWCGLPLAPGNCSFNTASQVRYFFNASSGQCQQFDYEGCESNGNNFETLQECQDTCRCVLPSDSGPCEAYSEMYFYNTTSGRCEMFVYGGCQGNDNRFSTMELCQQACRGDVGLSAPGCVLPSDSGPCEAYSEMYFYNATSGRCEMFVYGGCQGNDNRFSTMELCQQACRGDVGINDDVMITTGAAVRPQWWRVPSLLLSVAAMLVAMT